MKRLLLWILLTVSFAAAQGPNAPAAYQPIRVKFRVLDLDGRPLEGASLAGHLDAESSRLPPDRVLSAKSGADEFSYSLGDPGFTIFSNQQHVGPDGYCEVPFIVYSNRAEQPIDYELMALYNQPNRNVLLAADMHKGLTNADDGRTFILHANVRKQFEISSLLVALACWIGGTIMGFLLFFRGLYRYWLSNDKSVELSRALCISGTLFVCLFTLALVYWWLLPHIIGVWVLFGVCLTIWLLHFVVTMTTKRAIA